ncbi:MAG: glycosyltransferase family 4 protein [Pseudomonadota bacterium]
MRFIIPGAIDTPSGGYRYDRQIIEEMKVIGAVVDLVSLPGSTYPFPDEAAISKIDGVIAEAKSADIAVVDGLAGGVLPGLLANLASTMPVVALIHHPLFLEAGLSEVEADALRGSEAAGLSHVKAVITTSPATTRTVQEMFGFDPEHIHTVIPGVERGPKNKLQMGEEARILSIGSISERKGHDVMIDALARIKDLRFRLDIAGASFGNDSLLASLKHRTTQAGLDGRVTFHGAVTESELDHLYASADFFALASRYEGYGMVYAEAIVRGLPVIGTDGGAIPDTIPPDCGLIAKAGDPETLSEHLRTMIENHDVRQAMRQAALAAEPAFPTWKSAGALFLETLRGVA